MTGRCEINRSLFKKEWLVAVKLNEIKEIDWEL